MNNKIAVIGAGSWGCALALNLIKNNYNVNIFTLSEEQVKEINNSKTNKDYLPGITIPEGLYATNDIEEAIKDCTYIVLAVPSQAIRSVCNKLKPYLREHEVLINVAKGIEKETSLRMSEVCSEVLPSAEYCVLSGPSHAEEVAQGVPTLVTVASKDLEVAKKVQKIFSNEEFRVYADDDVVGVELGGAFKNIIAFGAGICDGLGFGSNTKAALITRGLYEVSILGEALGANRNCFTGLSGVGDLVVTCISEHSRNRKAGYLIGQGKTIEEALDEVKMVVEGITATEVAYNLSKKFDVETPIINAIYNALYGGCSAKESLKELMVRPLTTERKNY